MKLNLNKVFKTLFLLLLISLSEIRLSKVENDLRVALKNVFYNLKQGSPNQPAGKKVKKNYDVIFEKDTFKVTMLFILGSRTHDELQIS